MVWELRGGRRGQRLSERNNQTTPLTWKHSQHTQHTSAHIAPDRTAPHSHNAPHRSTPHRTARSAHTTACTTASMQAFTTAHQPARPPTHLSARPPTRVRMHSRTDIPPHTCHAVRLWKAVVVAAAWHSAKGPSTVPSSSPPAVACIPIRKQGMHVCTVGASYLHCTCVRASCFCTCMHDVFIPFHFCVLVCIHASGGTSTSASRPGARARHLNLGIEAWGKGKAPEPRHRGRP